MRSARSTLFQLAFAVLATALVSLPGARQANAQRGMLDDVPAQKGPQRVGPERAPAPPATAQPAPKQKDDRLRIPERPTTSFNFLEGCWISDLFKHSSSHSGGTSTYCFDANGRGTLVFQDAGTTCRVPATASYQSGLLKFVDSDGTCTTGPWFADHLDCERNADGLAFCHGSSKDDAGEVTRWTVTFRRQGASR